MISKEYEFGKTGILNRKKYTLVIDEDKNGNFIRFTVLPVSNRKFKKVKQNGRSNLPNIDDQRLIYNISRKYLSKQEKPLSRPKD
ncbi:unnamed protein product [Saccharomyces cerevisiae]|nr:unnamed protein product [Saccharomyces cerevisiae]